MKRFFCSIILLLTALIFLTACTQGTGPATDLDGSAAKNTIERIQLETLYEYDEAQELEMEYAVIMGMDSAENVIWTRVTDKYPAGQYYHVEEVLQTETQYIYVEYGTLIALDISTGEFLWKNSEFQGWGVRGLEDRNGNMYFCGHLGPAFFAINSNGKTLHKIESFGNEYNWANGLWTNGDKVMVVFELGPEKLRGPGGFVFHVDLDDYSFALQNEEVTEAVAESAALPALAGDIAQVLPMEWGCVVVLYTDGTVGVAGNDELAEKVSSWRNVQQLYWGTSDGNLVARMSDGTAASTEYDLSGWNNVKEIYVGGGIAGLREDGRVHAVGWEENSPDGWSEICDIAIINGLCFGLKNDGTVVCTDEDHVFAEVLCSLENVKEFHGTKRETDFFNTIYAILEDGKAVRYDSYEDWYDEAGINYLDGAVKFPDTAWPFAISADGNLLSYTTRQGWVYYNSDENFTNYPVLGHVSYDEKGNMRTEKENTEGYSGICVTDRRYQNIKDICYNDSLIILKYDGTVDSLNVGIEWDFEQWEDIESITVAWIYDCQRVYGVKKDGSVIVAECGYRETPTTMDSYLGWNILELYSGMNIFDGCQGVVGITPDGTLVGDGAYAEVDFSALIR